MAAHPPDVYKGVGDPNSVLTLVRQVLYPLNHLPSPTGWLSPTVEPTVSLKRSENLESQHIYGKTQIIQGIKQIDGIFRQQAKYRQAGRH